MRLKNKEDKKSRELALILIALAAGIKIYPAIFGLLYLREKRYKEAKRLVLYGILLFFAPFLFFGGLHGLVQMLKNQTQLHSQFHYGWNSITAVCNQIGRKFLSLKLTKLGELLSVLYTFIALSIFHTTHTEWKRLYLLCSLMVIVPSWSGSYTPIYFSIPLIYFYVKREKIKQTIYMPVSLPGHFPFSPLIRQK